jgi:hypothetical protein
VGVTGDMRRQGIESAVAPQVYLPHRQGSDNMMDLIVRTTEEPSKVAAFIRSQIPSIDKTVAKFNVRMADEEMGDQTLTRRFDTFLIGAFAVGALFLFAIGIYDSFIRSRWNGPTKSGSAWRSVRVGVQ